MMPLGIRCSAVFTPLITSVWPALWPPWKRTTPCALSVSQSTSLPLPSSPHWVPTTTTLRPRGFVMHCSRFVEIVRIGRASAWRARSIGRRSRTSSRSQWNSSTSLSWPGSTQTTVSPCSRSAAMAARSARRSSPPGRANRGPQRRASASHGDQFLHVQAEAHGRPVAAEHRADLVVAAAAHQRVAGAGA